jgi:hypothetical protein
VIAVAPREAIPASLQRNCAASCARKGDDSMKARCLIAAAALVCLTAAPAAAYTCTIAPHGDSVIIKTSNTGAAPKICTVTCRFTFARFSCTQNIPAGASNWFVCVRSTRGKNLGALQGGSETCR